MPRHIKLRKCVVLSYYHILVCTCAIIMITITAASSEKYQTNHNIIWSQTEQNVSNYCILTMDGIRTVLLVWVLDCWGRLSQWYEIGVIWLILRWVMKGSKMWDNILMPSKGKSYLQGSFLTCQICRCWHILVCHNLMCVCGYFDESTVFVVTVMWLLRTGHSIKFLPLARNFKFNQQTRCEMLQGGR